MIDKLVSKKEIVFFLMLFPVLVPLFVFVLPMGGQDVARKASSGTEMKADVAEKETVVKEKEQATPFTVADVENKPSAERVEEREVVVDSVEEEVVITAPVVEEVADDTVTDSIVVDLVVEPEASAPYNRKEWGSWRKSVDVYLRWKQDETSCIWAFYSPTAPHCLSGVDRDHLVALKEAHDSGGHAWSSGEKRDYYNDTKNLYVMPSGENRSKSDRDPADWKPENDDAWCRYAQEWITIKQKHKLSADQREVSALEEMLGTC
ncbi:MAG: hypothetical protein OYG31_01715 [Candidatus Kaiserbacteria bacterium]|nr:hypothetical protein [Candidatus Kaiserbacteria bacterium]